MSNSRVETLDKVFGKRPKNRFVIAENCALCILSKISGIIPKNPLKDMSKITRVEKLTILSLTRPKSMLFCIC